MLCQLKINIYKHGRLGTKRSLENFKILILLLFHPLFWYDLFMIRKSDHHQKTWNDQRSGGYWTVNFVIWILNLCTITSIWVLDINFTPSFLTIHLLKVWHCTGTLLWKNNLKLWKVQQKKRTQSIRWKSVEIKKWNDQSTSIVIHVFSVKQNSWQNKFVVKILYRNIFSSDLDQWSSTLIIFDCF